MTAITNPSKYVNTSSGKSSAWYVATGDSVRASAKAIGTASTAVITVTKAWTVSDSGTAFTPAVTISGDGVTVAEEIDCSTCPYLRFEVTTNEASKSVEVVVHLQGAPDPFPLERQPYMQVAKGEVAGESVTHKFGKNLAVGTSFVPIAIGGIYRTPQAASATTLRIKAGGNANDTAAGTGAREITLIGLDETGAEVSETVATAGASASSATTATFMRLYRCFVSASGTYATQSAASHAGDIVIENGAGGTDWATIDADGVGGFPRAQSEIGAYSVPTGYTAYLLNVAVFSSSTKVCTALVFRRGSILDAAAPYEGMRVLAEERVDSGSGKLLFVAPVKITGPADVGVLAKVDAGNAVVDVDFEIILVKD